MRKNKCSYTTIVLTHTRTYFTNATPLISDNIYIQAYHLDVCCDSRYVFGGLRGVSSVPVKERNVCDCATVVGYTLH